MASTWPRVRCKTTAATLGGTIITPLEIASHGDEFLRQRGRLKVFAASEATVIVGTNGIWYQLCQMGFARDGSFHVAWPYLPVHHGIVAEVSFPVGKPAGPVELSLTERGRFTSQLVKFSHHTSGIAQFSLTGGARSDVRRKSFRLDGPLGHLFQIQCQHPKTCKQLSRMKPRRLYLAFYVPDLGDSDFLLYGDWTRKRAILDNVVGAGNVGPLAPHKNRFTGAEGPVFFWSPPLDSPLEPHVLMLGGGALARPKGAVAPGVVLMGGFDEHEVQPGEDRYNRIVAGLVAMYPATGAEELRQRLGSIDISPGAGGPEVAKP